MVYLHMGFNSITFLQSSDIKHQSDDDVGIHFYRLGIIRWNNFILLFVYAVRSIIQKCKAKHSPTAVGII